MTAFFLSIIERSLAASFVIFAVIAARALTRRSPKWTRGVLWTLVALRLILPFTLHSAVSLVPELPKFTDEQIRSTSVSPTDAPTAVGSVLSTVPPSVTDIVDPAPVGSAMPSTVPVSPEVQSTVPQNTVPKSTLAQDATAPESVQGASVADIAAIVWVVGAALLLLYFAIGYARLWTQVRSATRTERGTWQCDQIDSAFVFGVVRPRIFLPGDIDPTAAEYMIAHERAHIRRGDHITKLLAFFLLAVHWFNPMVWLAYVLFCRDVELACDEYALRSIEPGRVSEYARTLLTVGAAPKSVAVYPLSFSRHSIQARIKNILNYKKPSFWAIVAALIVCVITAACFATAPIAEDRDSTDAPTPATTAPTTDATKEVPTEPTPDHIGEALFAYDAAAVRSVEISWQQDTERTARLSAAEGQIADLTRFASSLRYCAPADAQSTLAGLTVTLTYEDEHTEVRDLGTTTLDGVEYAVCAQEETEFFTVLREELGVYFAADGKDDAKSAYTFLLLELDPADTVEWEETSVTVHREGMWGRKIDRTKCTIFSLTCGQTEYLLLSNGALYDLQKDVFTEENYESTKPTVYEPEPEPEPEPEHPITVKWTDTVPSGTAIQYGRGHGRTLDELPKSQVINELTAAAPIICIRSWNEYTYVMSALLVDAEAYENYIEYEPYDEDFFQDEALIILCQGSGPRKGDELNTRLIKSGSELCIRNQLHITRTKDNPSPTFEWQGFSVLTVSKADLSDIDTISLFVETVYHPNINDDFTDDCVLVVVKDEYRDTVFTKEQFEATGAELTSAECIAFKVIYSLYLANKGKEEVLKAITKLEQLEFIKVAEPNYHMSIDWDV